MTAYRAPTFTLAAPRERAWWERALVSVGRRVHALRWLPAYRRAVGGRWVAVKQWWPQSDSTRTWSWVPSERCPADWSVITTDELAAMLSCPREIAMCLNHTREQHLRRCTCEVYP